MSPTPPRVPAHALAFTDAQGRPIRLGKEIARGGEGRIHLVDGQPDRVAKIYLRSPDATRLAKIHIMTAQNWSDELRRVVAMPISALYDSHAEVCGVLMPLIEHHLSSEQLTLASGRRAHFPHADWHFMVHVAKNLAAAVEVVHNNQLIIGDLNDGSYLIRKGAGTVALVDVDSFQISTPLGIYRCQVGKPLFTAPELHHVDFSTCVRTIDHDNFALAILIFQLLFLGRHPFAGRPLTAQEIPPERAVEELRFAYGRDAARRGIQRPPNILTLDALTPKLADMFEQAFAPTGRQPGNRPNAVMWRQGLDQQLRSMRACPDNQAHTFTKSLSVCPWCVIERTSQAVLFACLIHARTTAGNVSADVQTLLRDLETFPLLPLCPDPPEPTAKATAAAMSPALVHRHRQTQHLQWLIAGSGVVLVALVPVHLGIIFSLCLISVVLLYRPHHLKAELELRQAAGQQAQEDVTLLRLRWQIEASGANVHKTKQELMVLVRDWRSGESGRPADAATLEALARTRQLADHLERCLLQTAAISGLSAGRKAILISYGIPSAAQVDETSLAQVPGLASDLAQALMAWRQACEKRFVFDSTYSRQDLREQLSLAAVEHRKLLAERLLSGHAQLQALASDALAQRLVLSRTLEQAQERLAQAQADLSAITRLCRYPFLNAR